jgi:hypothetical protein
MNEILTFLIRSCSHLWTLGYRFTDSGAAASFGGDAYVVIESGSLRMRFVRDRGQLFLDFQEPAATGKDVWYSIDLVRHLLTGVRQESAELNEDYAQFLGGSLTDIERLFSDEAIPETKRQLQNLKRVRAKELFG